MVWYCWGNTPGPLIYISLTSHVYIHCTDCTCVGTVLPTSYYGGHLPGLAQHLGTVTMNSGAAFAVTEAGTFAGANRTNESGTVASIYLPSLSSS